MRSAQNRVVAGKYNGTSLYTLGEWRLPISKDTITSINYIPIFITTDTTIIHSYIWYNHANKPPYYKTLLSLLFPH